MFVIINDVGIKIVGMMINAGVNAKNWLIKAYAIKDLFGILVIVSANVDCECKCNSECKILWF